MRATKSTTSCSAMALSSESIGTACRTFLKRPVGAAPTRFDGESGRTRSRKARLDRRVALAQSVIGGVGDLGRVFLIVAPVVLGDGGGQPLQLGLGLRRGEVGDRDFAGVFGCHTILCHSGARPLGREPGIHNPSGRCIRFTSPRVANMERSIWASPTIWFGAFTNTRPKLSLDLQLDTTSSASSGTKAMTIQRMPSRGRRISRNGAAIGRSV